MQISVFGSAAYEKDSALIKLLPQLKKTFPQHQFIYQDPTEDLIIPKDEWWILDMAEGIDKITVFNNLDQFTHKQSTSVHDYDLYMELKLNEKLGRLPKLKIIAVPLEWEKEKILSKLKKHLS